MKYCSDCLCSTCRKKKKGKCEGLCIEKLGAVEICTSYCDYRKNIIVELIKNFFTPKVQIVPSDPLDEA